MKCPFSPPISPLRVEPRRLNLSLDTPCAKNRAVLPCRCCQSLDPRSLSCFFLSPFSSLGMERRGASRTTAARLGRGS